MKQTSVIVIGIAGGTGSGKSTLIQKIQEEFCDNVTVISHDSYYKARSDRSFEQRAQLNYDHPDAFDTDLMIQHIKQLKSWEDAWCPVYDFTIYDRTAEQVRLKPTKVIVSEGILIFENRELLDLLDIKVFVDTDADVRIIRRILRDVKERGRTLDSVVNQYLTTVKPMHEQFVEPSKKYADIIIPEGGFNMVALQMLNQRIHALLDEE
ncbi:uridine kinase [Aminipila butyrica]|uniref:Uridine kinase n=1 Tax=Aminipila butyrica TaxID=433296 RepID=A0A858BRQ8_9FIRM|nr:uridine kinase [Aminipila butyrica]QIB68002.1 uridine kinase [Aminipila butyrica]